MALTAAAADLRPEPLRSGIEFAGADVRALQADEFSNPAMLWVARGEQLWREPPGGGGGACAACHGETAASLRGVAARYPRVDPESNQLVNLEGRVNLCRQRHQNAPPFDHESEPLLALSAYVASFSKGLPVAASEDAAHRAALERGRARYHTRIGQMNLACTHCHDQRWGRRLGPETISQGHGNAFPAYRLEWQSVGSLSRRIRACYYGVRAEMPAYGSQALLELELYLAWRARGLPFEAPGVRR